jgi:hypothetical protein
LGSDREKVRTRLDSDTRSIDEPHVGFVNEGGGLQQMVGLLPSHVASRETTELVVDERQKLIERGLVAASPIHKKAGDLA